MEEQILAKLVEQEKKIEAIYASVEKTRHYFLWTIVISVITVALPLIGIVVALPFIMSGLSAYTSAGLL